MGEKRIGKEERMSYFPEDIPFMSKEELKENGIRIPKDATDTNVGDTISRQAAINIVEAGRLTKLIDAETVVNSLRELQPVQLKPQEGKWVLGFDNKYMEKYYYCSRCGCRKYEEHKPLDYFCSNCGADMRGEQDE